MCIRVCFGPHFELASFDRRAVRVHNPAEFIATATQRVHPSTTAASFDTCSSGGKCDDFARRVSGEAVQRGRAIDIR
jgi:hypothetical protein